MNTPIELRFLLKAYDGPRQCPRRNGYWFHPPN
jgi:hypothetical protein